MASSGGNIRAGKGSHRSGHSLFCLPEGEGETPVNELYTNIEQQEENQMQQKRNQQAEIRLGMHLL